MIDGTGVIVGVIVEEGEAPTLNQEVAESDTVGV
jgi:hypothetical protein